MKKFSFYILFFTILSSQPLIAGILPLNPATNEEEISLISPESERNMGKNIHKQVLKHYKLPVDPLAEERIEGIGARLAKGSDRKDVVYHFTVLNHEKENMYNAFSAPGGYVYIFDDLVDVLKEDNNIAAVLAHEMAHIEARHSVKRLQGSIGSAALVLLGAEISKNRKDTYSAGMAMRELMSAYSREDEEKADELSVKYLRSSGYGPAGIVDSLLILKKLREKAPRMRYPFYRSHPYISERIAHISNFIKGGSDFDSYINTTENNNDF